MADAKIVGLYRYPVKGFSPEPLQKAGIEAGGTMPFDRAFAIENGPSGFDPAKPAYFPKARFLMLMKDERMAEFSTRFEDATGMFRIFRDGALQAEGSLDTSAGRAAIEAWLSKNFSAELRGPPKILSAPGHSFSDKRAKVLHLINLTSVRALQEQLGTPVDPLRFRPNIVIDGAPAWSEIGWRARISFPKLQCKVESRTTRCAATNVDPQTGRRDMEIPQALDALYGHADFGVYLVATGPGALAIGDALNLPAAADREGNSETVVPV